MQRRHMIRSDKKNDNDEMERNFNGSLSLLQWKTSFYDKIYDIHISVYAIIPNNQVTVTAQNSQSQITLFPGSV